MKKILIILFTLISVNSLHSQFVKEVEDALIQIRNTVPISPQEVEFELHLLRYSDLWRSYANGTYQIKLYVDPKGPANNIDYSKLEFTRIATDLDSTIGSATVQNIGSKYYIEQKVAVDSISGRLLVNILGPQNFEDALVVPLTDENAEFDNQETILLGRFKIKHTDIKSKIPPVVRWIEPVPYFQSTAFKNDQGLLVYGVNDYFERHDNIELVSPELNIASRFRNDPTEPPPFRLSYFDATYIGGEEIQLRWKTNTEIFLDGFVIKRTILDYFATPEEFADSSLFDDAIIAFTYDKGNPIRYNQMLESEKTYKSHSTEYGPLIDDFTQIDNNPNPKLERGKWYCYQIYKVDYVSASNTDAEFPLARAFVKIPNSVIAYSQASPNPFSGSTRIDYELDDDVNLQVGVYDVQGKLVKELVAPNTFTRKGTYTFDLTMPENATQGLYNVIFNAAPINDDQVRSSTANIKLQMIK